MGSMRLLFAVPFAPRFDNRHGGRVVANLLSGLARHHDVAVVYLTATDTRPLDPQLAQRCKIVQPVELRHGLPEPGWRHRGRVLVAPLTGRPSPVESMYSRRLASAVSELAVQWQPDVIEIEHDSIAYCVSALTGVGAARILVCHDPGAKASADQASVTSGRQRVSHLLDAALWRRYWSATLPKFDGLVAFTDEDVAMLKPYAPRALITRVPLVVDLPERTANPLGGADPTVAYIGGYSHPPNGDAAMRLIRGIMPLVRNRVPQAKLFLVGDKPTEAMRHAATQLDVITGRVDSVASYLDQASVVALPIRLGGGMRVKLLEALGAGKAVVVSPLAAASLDLTDGEEVLLAESDKQFADGIARLLSDASERRRIAAGARAWAVRNLSVDARVRDYESLYARLVANPS